MLRDWADLKAHNLVVYRVGFLIRSDNGSEISAKIVPGWSGSSEQGRSITSNPWLWENGYRASFNRTSRSECPNGKILYSLKGGHRPYRAISQAQKHHWTAPMQQSLFC